MTVPSAEVTEPVWMSLMVCSRPGSAGRVDQAQRLPVMSVEVGEPALVTVAFVPWRADRAAARRLGLIGQLVHLVTGFHAENQDYLGTGGRVHDAPPLTKGAKPFCHPHDPGGRA